MSSGGWVEDKLHTARSYTRLSFVLGEIGPLPPATHSAASMSPPWRRVWVCGYLRPFDGVEGLCCVVCRMAEMCACMYGKHNGPWRCVFFASPPSCALCVCVVATITTTHHCTPSC